MCYFLPEGRGFWWNAEEELVGDKYCFHAVNNFFFFGLNIERKLMTRT